MRRQYYWSLLVLFLVGAIVWHIWRIQRRADRCQYEEVVFMELGGLAADMIWNKEKGVVVDSGRAFIFSFDDFVAYVQRKKPALVSSPQSPTPFQGLLPDRPYGRLVGPATQPSDLLFWSTEIHERPGGEVFHYMLKCDGSIQRRVGGDSVRVAPSGYSE